MNFLKKNWRLCFGCYIFIYLPWFFYLEKKITMETPNLHIINNAIDDMIPFCVYFIIPYMLWFIYVIGTCIYMLFKASDTEFLQFRIMPDNRHVRILTDLHDLSERSDTAPR